MPLTRGGRDSDSTRLDAETAANRRGQLPRTSSGRSASQKVGPPPRRFRSGCGASNTWIPATPRPRGEQRARPPSRERSIPSHCVWRNEIKRVDAALTETGTPCACARASSQKIAKTGTITAGPLTNRDNGPRVTANSTRKTAAFGFVGLSIGPLVYIGVKRGRGGSTQRLGEGGYRPARGRGSFVACIAKVCFGQKKAT